MRVKKQWRKLKLGNPNRGKRISKLETESNGGGGNGKRREKGGGLGSCGSRPSL